MAEHKNGRSNSERQAFEKELLEHYTSLRAFAVSLSRRHDKADDLVQDTMFKALQKYESFEMGTSMKAWLFTILRNEFYSQMRKRGREVGWIEGLEDSLEHSTMGSDGGASYDFHKHLVYIASLQRDQCDAFIAVCYLGMSYEEAAGRLNCAVGTMKSRVSRARDRLVKLIESQTTIREAKFESYKTASRGVPESHPFYPIAKAYEELFATSEDVKEKEVDAEPGRNGNGSQPAPTQLSESDRLWEVMVRSGILDNAQEDLSELMQSDLEEY